ncbi:MAG TPA: SMP-30/gluconolactonase/LRE family protein [Candidatus Binatia bacterium]|nr:SMP-30/gluconolactonase/LRE family protein [Candidatus Binatia bacterium]
MTGGRAFGRLALGIALACAVAACGGGGGGDKPNDFNALPDPAPPAGVELGGLIGPEGLTFDSAGNLYAGSTTGRITRISPSGVVSVFAETGRSLAGLATGPQDEIFAAAFNTGEVVAVGQDSVMRVATSGLDGPNAMVFDPQQRLLVTALGIGGFPQVATVQPDTTYLTITEEIPSPNGIAFGPDGFLYIADTFMNRIVRMTYNDRGEVGAPETYATGIGFPDGIAFDKAGHLFVAASGQIWVVLPDGTSNRRSQPFVVSGALDGPASLAFGFGPGRDTGRLYFTNYGFPSLGSGTTVASVLVGIPGEPLFAP